MFNCKVINSKNFHADSAGQERSMAFVSINYEEKPVLDPVYNIFDKEFIANFQALNDFSAKALEHIETTVPYRNGLAKLIFIGAGQKSNLIADAFIKLGGVTSKLLSLSDESFVFFDITEKDKLCDFLVGLSLASYKFDKYLVTKSNSKSNKEKAIKGRQLTVIVNDSLSAADIKEAIDSANITSDSVILARDLVNEPANVLDTTAFKQRIEELHTTGLKIDILAAEELKKLGMNALLAVAQGSKNPPYVAIMSWQGDSDASKAPLVFVGKGVVFDSGGISLKPAANMEDMKGDMAGAAAVTALLQLLANRKCKINVIGIVGLVENMPSSTAMCPGNVVHSMSGQTIEIINTDAEGRLVLADLLHYANERFSPVCMVNLATLTGAILVALGQQHAGLFCNNEQLSSRLLEAGGDTGEELWQLPLGKAYDEMVDSTIADMRNSAGRHAGSITAAQFLKRFVGDTPWAHLDIAGTAFGVKQHEYCSSWATGFGVRLLDRFVDKFYEN